jgi:hypothetical protein
VKKISRVICKILAFSCAFTFSPEILSTRTVGIEFNHFRLKPEDFIATESRYCG